MFCYTKVYIFITLSYQYTKKSSEEKHIYGILKYIYKKAMEPSAAAAGFGHLFSWRHPATMDLSHAAYRYNQNMMEYYTCKSKSVFL